MEKSKQLLNDITNDLESYAINVDDFLGNILGAISGSYSFRNMYTPDKYHPTSGTCAPRQVLL